MKPPVLPDVDLPSISFYGDASSRQREYMVVGGLAVSGNRIDEIEHRIAAIKAEVGMKSEFHFADYRGGRKQTAYENLISYAFELIERRQAALHVIIAKFGGLENEVRETRDTRINKLYFQLCLHRLAQFYGAKQKKSMSGSMLEMIQSTSAACEISYVRQLIDSTRLCPTAFVLSSPSAPGRSV